MFELPKLERLLTAEDFEGWVGQPVRLDTRPEPVVIELNAVVRRLGSRLAHRVPFSLFFRSSWNVILVDGVYVMSCGRSGPYEVALTPITPEPPLRIYQAVFG